MDRMGPRVARLLEHLFGLDDLVNGCLGGIGLHIHNIQARGAEPGDDQVAPLEERVAGQRRQGRRAGVPTAMVELVARVRHRHRVDDLAKGGRAGLDVDHRERVGLREVRAEEQRVGEVLRRSFHRQLRGCVEGRIRPHGHGGASLEVSLHTATTRRHAALWSQHEITRRIAILARDTGDRRCRAHDGCNAALEQKIPRQRG